MHCVGVFFMFKTVLLPQSILNLNMHDSHIHNAKMYPGVIVCCSLFPTSYALMSKKDMVWKVISL